MAAGADPILDQLRPLEAAIEAAAKANKPELVKQFTLEIQRVLGSHNPSITSAAFQPSSERMPADIQSVVGAESGLQQGFAGAGAGTNRLVQGVTQAFGGDVSPQEIADNRSLQDATPMTKAGAMAGTVAPFAVAPARVGGQLLGPALRMAGREVPSALQLGRAGMVGDAAATGGALSALTQPGGWEDRGRAGMYGLAGAAIPTGAVAAVQGGRRIATAPGQRIGIAEKIGEDLGDSKAQELAQALSKDTYPARGYGVNPSAAMASGDPTLSVWELGSRTRQGDLWTGLDKANAQSRWEELLRRSDPAQGAALRATRAEKTGALRDEAMEAGVITSAMANSKGIPAGELAPIRAKINELRTGDAKPNANVQHMVDWLEKNLHEVTPGQLYEVRKLMTEDIPKGMNDQLGAALKSARPQRIELVRLIDEALDTVSGGSYGEYMAKYRALSPEISSNAALQRMADSLRGGLGQGVVPPSMGASPAPATVGRLLKKEGERTFGAQKFDQLTPTDRAWADVLQGDLASQAQNMKAQAMVGSATAGNAEAAGRGASALARVTASHLGNAATGGLGGSMATAALDRVLKMNERELAALLQNPKALAEALKNARSGAQIIRGSGQVGSGAAQALREELMR